MTHACRHVAARIGMLAYPNPIVAQHVAPVPYLGGLAVALAALLTIGLAWWYPALRGSQAALPSSLLVVGGITFLLLGLADDARPLSPFRKLGLQTALAFALLLGLAPTHGLPASPVWLVLGTVWVVTIANAVNVTDVCDGLVAGLSCIALIVIAWTRPDSALWARCLLGACGGFLIVNWPPARIYLGDAGSHLLGYTLAVMTLPDPASIRVVPGSLLFGPLLLGVFLFELSFITTMRLNKGLKWWKGSPDHFALRTQAAGFSKVSTVLGACAAAVPLALAAVGVHENVGEGWRLSLLGIVSLEVIAAWLWLRGLDVIAAK